MQSILGIIKNFGLPGEVVYDTNLNPINFKHFCVLNFVLSISKIENIKNVNFIFSKNFEKLSNEETKNFLDKYDLIVQFSNNYKNSEEYILKNKKKFVFLDSPIIFRQVKKTLLSQKYLRVMAGDSLGNNYIKKYNKNKIRDNFHLPEISKKSKNGDSILLINQMVNDSAVRPLDPYSWAEAAISKIRISSKENIIFRDHPLQRNIYKDKVKNILENENIFLSNKLNIEEEFERTKYCVTLSSGSAIDCLFAGIPTIATDKRSFVYEIVENKIDKIETLNIPNLHTLNSAISFTHFTLTEIIDGTCWKNLKEFF